MNNEHEPLGANTPNDPAEPVPAPDPVNRWATEHYGFEDAPASPPETPSSAPYPSTPTVSRRLSRKMLIGAGVLGVLLAGGVGGAAIAADGGDGQDGGGRDGVFQGDGNGRFGGDNDDDDGGRDGDFR
jgi:hypothetical protein